MKRNITTLICFGVLTTTISSIDFAAPTSSSRIIGSGILITEQRKLTGFHSVSMNSAGKVNITYGSEQEVSVTVDDNIMSHITTEVNDGTLEIGTQRGVHLSHYDLTLNLTLTELKALYVNSVGYIHGTNKFQSDVVYLGLQCTGDIHLEIQADYLISSLSSTGDLTLRGSVANHLSELSSTGSLHAFDLQTESTEIALSSTGNGEISVSDKLDVELTSIGSLYYKGNPEIRQIDTSIGDTIDAN